MEGSSSQIDATGVASTSGLRGLTRVTGKMAQERVCLIAVISQPETVTVEGQVLRVEPFALRSGRVEIGRGEDCDIRLGGETVSRCHCEISCEMTKSGMEYLLTDRSRNGTYVNGRRASTCHLRDGDRVQIGLHLLEVKITGSRTTGVVMMRATGVHQADTPGVAAAGVASGLPAEPPSGTFVVKGLENGVTQQFVERRITIGRRPGNHLLLNGDLVSRDHAAMVSDAEGCWLIDLGSVNGTFVNGERIERVMLGDGDRITIGEFECLATLRGSDCLLYFRQSGRLR